MNCFEERKLVKKELERERRKGESDDGKLGEFIVAQEEVNEIHLCGILALLW